MRIDELINFNPVSSTAMAGIGKDQPDEVLPQNTKTVDDDGTSYTWKGRQWVNDKDKRMASRDKGKRFTDREMAKNHEGDVHVVFANGWAYIYHDVPRNVYDSWMKAGSKGRFLNQHIKGTYRYTRNQNEDL